MTGSQNSFRFLSDSLNQQLKSSLTDGIANQRLFSITTSFNRVQDSPFYGELLVKLCIERAVDFLLFFDFDLEAGLEAMFDESRLCDSTPASTE